MSDIQIQRTALHENVADALQKEIVSAQRAPGDMLPGMRQLAKQFGVSINTLRAALLLLQDRGAVTVRHGKGVFVKGHEGPLRVGVFSEMDILMPRLSSYHTQLPRALRRIFSAKGAQSRIYVGTSTLGENRGSAATWDLLEDLEQGRLDALAVHGLPRNEWLITARNRGIPVVGDNHVFEYGVAIDTPGMLREGIRRLHAVGCRHIAVMGWTDFAVKAITEDLLQEVGLEFRSKWVKDDLEPMLSGAGWDEFRELWTAYEEKPDGLIVGDDVLFTEAWTAIAEIGIRVPDQLHVIAHTNAGCRLPGPSSITFAEFDPADVAARMAHMLQKLAKGEPVANPHEFSPVRWVERSHRNKFIADPRVDTEGAIGRVT